MGREAVCRCEWPGGSGEVKALLESTEIVVRGALRRRLPLATLQEACCVGPTLRVRSGQEQILLHLGAAEAARWLSKIRTPPPTLRDKLGLAAAKALVYGNPGSVPPLRVALAGAMAETAADATVLVAIVDTATQLAGAVALYRQLPPAAPFWVVHGKGRGAPFGEAAARAAMRAAGFMDNKVCAVSDERSATRFAPGRQS